MDSEQSVSATPLRCPLRRFQDNASGDTIFYDCYGERCAWWIKGDKYTRDGCVVMWLGGSSDAS
jgi:hypothetical protein